MGSKSTDSRVGSRIKAPYLGKISLYWCHQCNLPILDKIKCEICQSTSKKVSISPPGDVRPAFPKDYELIAKTVNFQYGKPLGNIIFNPSNSILLNRIGGLDRTDEVILFGQRVGIFTYNPIKSQYEFHPKLFGGELILKLQEKLKLEEKKKIELNSDGLPFILKGKSILAPGVNKFSSDIQVGDYVLVTYKPEHHEKNINLKYNEFSENSILVSIGLAQASSNEFQKMLNENFGALCKNNKYRKSINSESILKINKLVELLLKTYDTKKNSSILAPIDIIRKNIITIFNANHTYMKRKVQDASQFIQSAINKIQKSVAVAYSGGKDSLATLLLVWDSIGPNFKIFFADTGLELPEVKENVVKIAKTFSMEEKLNIRRADETFWKIVDSFGPPGRDYRYCCHSLKAQNITSIIESLYEGEKILVFLGQRQYESITRSKSPKIYTNSFIPLQIAATPIKDWNALVLWLYIFNFSSLVMSQSKKKLPQIPINPLYFEGHERLGCYLCPASNLSTFELLKNTHPKLYDRWFSYLEKYRIQYQLPKEWINWGLWRYKRLPIQWYKLVEQSNFSLEFISLDPSSPLTFQLTKGFSPCLQDGFSIKGKYSRPLDLDVFNQFLPALTQHFEYDEDLHVISIDSSWKKHHYILNLYSDGALFLQTPDENFPLSDFMLYFTGSLFRSQYCNECKTCEMVCPTKAISFHDGNIQIDSKKCTNCLLCISHCPFFQSAKKISF